MKIVNRASKAGGCDSGMPHNVDGEQCRPRWVITQMNRVTVHMHPHPAPMLGHADSVGEPVQDSPCPATQFSRVSHVTNKHSALITELYHSSPSNAQSLLCCVISIHISYHVMQDACSGITEQQNTPGMEEPGTDFRPR